MSSFFNIRAMVVKDEPWLVLDDLAEVMADDLIVEDIDPKYIQVWKIKDDSSGLLKEIEMVSLKALTDHKAVSDDIDDEAEIEPDDLFDDKEPMPSATYKKLSVADLNADQNMDSSNLPIMEFQQSNIVMVPEKRTVQNSVISQEELAVKIRAYLNRQLPSDWGKLDAKQRLAFLDNPELPGRLIRDRVILEEIIIECLRRPQDMNNLNLQSTLTDIMASFPEWERVRSIKPYRPYKRGIGYKRIY